MPWTAGLTVRAYTRERARVGHRRVVEALIEAARERGLAGATVTRALASDLPGPSDNGAHDGDPVIVEIVDRVERIEAALPAIAALVPHGALSVTPARIYLPASRLRARDALERPDATLPPEAPATEALDILLHRGARLIPVLDAEHKPIGVVTLTHLLAQVDGDLAAHLLTLSQPEHMREHLEPHVEGKSARDVMRSPALTVRDDASLDAAARTLTGRHITRAPVVDAHGHYVGVVSEHELVKALIRGAPHSEADASRMAPTHAETHAALAASVEPAGGEPLTAGLCADRTIPMLPESASWDEIAQAVEASGVALVVDTQGLLRGVVEEEALLARATGGGAAAPQASGIMALRRLLAQATGQPAELPGQAASELRAGDLCQPARLIVAPETPLAQALARMVKEDGADYAVIAAPDSPPESVLWREDALRALVGG